MSAQSIQFSFNWNNKLNNDCFTTIREHNPNKYAVGKTFDILLKTKDGYNTCYAPADVIEIRRIKGKDINEFITRLDMGLSLDDGRRVMHQTYSDRCPNVMEMEFDFILLAYQKKKMTVDR